jgi:hypothetical protein
MKPAKNKIFRIALIAIFYISCAKDHGVQVASGPVNHPRVYTQTLDSVFYATPTTTTSNSIDYIFYLPVLDTAQNPVIKLYTYNPSNSIMPIGWYELQTYTRLGGHFSFSHLNLSNWSVPMQVKINAKW